MHDWKILSPRTIWNPSLGENRIQQFIATTLARVLSEGNKRYWCVGSYRKRRPPIIILCHIVLAFSIVWILASWIFLCVYRSRPMLFMGHKHGVRRCFVSECSRYQKDCCFVLSWVPQVFRGWQDGWERPLFSRQQAFLDKELPAKHRDCGNDRGPQRQSRCVWRWNSDGGWRAREKNDTTAYRTNRNLEFSKSKLIQSPPDGMKARTQ